MKAGEQGMERTQRRGGEERQRERERSGARCYCPVCQLLEGENKANLWSVAYHMSVSLSLTLCSVIHSHTRASVHSLWEMCDSISFAPPPSHTHPPQLTVFTPSGSIKVLLEQDEE